MPTQWYSLVEDVRKNNPFTVASMRVDEFKDLKTFSKNFINRKVTTDKEKLNFQKVRWFRFSKTNPEKISVRYSLDCDEEWKKWNISHPRVRLDADVVLTGKYEESSRPINSQKLEDLMKIMPEAYHAFYDALTSTASDSDSDTDAEYIH